MLVTHSSIRKLDNWNILGLRRITYTLHLQGVEELRLTPALAT